MTVEIKHQGRTIRTYFDLGIKSGVVLADAAVLIHSRFQTLKINKEYLSDIVAAFRAGSPDIHRSTWYTILQQLLVEGLQVDDTTYTIETRERETASPYEKTKMVLARVGPLEDYTTAPMAKPRHNYPKRAINHDSAAVAAPVRVLRVERVAPQTYQTPVSAGSVGEPAPQPLYAPPAPALDVTALVAAMRAAGFAPNPAPVAQEASPPAPVARLEPFEIPQRDELTRAMIDILATDEFRAAMVATIANVEASKWFWNHMRLMIMEKFDLDLKEQTARALTNRLNLCVKETWDTLDADIKERIDHEFKESQLAQARAESAHLKVDSLRADLRPTIDGLRATTDALRIQAAKLNEIGVEPRLVVLEDHLRQAGRRLLALETGALS